MVIGPASGGANGTDGRAKTKALKVLATILATLNILSAVSTATLIFSNPLYKLFNCLVALFFCSIKLFKASRLGGHTIFNSSNPFPNAALGSPIPKLSLINFKIKGIKVSVTLFVNSCNNLLCAEPKGSSKLLALATTSTWSLSKPAESITVSLSISLVSNSIIPISAGKTLSSLVNGFIVFSL